MMIPLLTAIIAFCAVFTALGLMFNILLGPVKENQVRMGRELDQFKQELGHLKQDLAQFKVEINVKLDKLLSKHSN